MDYTVHGILQARILEWVTFPFSRGSSQPKDWTQVSRIAGRFFTNWVIREAHKESWVPKNGYFRIVVLEKTFESPLNSTQIKPVHPKGNQPWIFIGRTDTGASVLWPPDAKSWLIGKDSDAGKDWGQEEKEASDDKMIVWHHRLNGQKFEQPSGDSEEQGSLVCCSPWSYKESDTT